MNNKKVINKVRRGLKDVGFDITIMDSDNFFIYGINESYRIFYRLGNRSVLFGVMDVGLTILTHINSYSVYSSDNVSYLGETTKDKVMGDIVKDKLLDKIGDLI